jgi:hypothetical protein
MARELFTFEEFNKDFWTYFRNKQKEIIKQMENECEEEDDFMFSDDIVKKSNNGKLRKRLREI